MVHYLLDTNIVSHLIRRHPAVSRRILHVPIGGLFLSAVTEGELRYGLARHPRARGLEAAVRELLRRVEVLPWDSAGAQSYGVLRAEMEQRGRALAPLDLSIAAHAVATGMTLATADRAFRHVPGLAVEDWTES